MVYVASLVFVHVSLCVFGTASCKTYKKTDYLYSFISFLDTGLRNYIVRKQYIDDLIC
jgi:hypothetical protein